MSVVRVVVVALLLSCVAASIVGFVSRTPAPVRIQSGPTTVPSSGFTDEQVARHGAFRGPLYLAFAFGVLLELTLLVLLRGRPMGQLVSWLEAIPGGWPVRAAPAAI